MNTLAPVDWVVIASYFGGVFGIAWWVIKQRQSSSADYFLAGKNVGWFVVGASLFASNIGSEHLVGLAGTGAESGVVFGHLEFQASLILLILGWVFVPFYTRSRVYTMPEFLERRYSPAARWFLSIISVFGYVLTKVCVTIYAGGVVFETLMGIDFWTGALIIVVLTGFYTVLGGLRAVVYTEVMQSVVLIAGAVAVTGIGLAKVGGWHALYEIAGSEYFNVWKPISHPDFPWTGMVFGAPIIAIWYWCTDQYIVQRTLAARNEAEARRGTIFAGFLKQLPLFIFIFPGIIAYALSTQGQLALAEPDRALPALVMALLPVGLRGLVAAGLLAALMSSLSAVFNSCSTLITMDFYKKLHPGASDKQLIHIGRIATVVLVGLGMAWIPLMKLISGTLYLYLQSVQSYISPPIAAVFLLGVFSKRINAPAAISALVGGFLIGMARLVAELNKASLSGVLHTFASINFLHFAIFLFLFCIALMILVSLLTREPTSEELKGLTYATTTPTEREQSRATWTRIDVILSMALFVIVAFIVLYFRG
ncbi:MAG: sodium:solute symporter [Acidobacteriota bacterium]